MATNFPTAKDDNTNLPNPAANNFQNNPDHASLHGNANDAIKALETKTGTGASVPAVNTLLIGTGPGTSSWSQLTSAQLAAILTDETGTGSAVFANTPVLITPKIDTIQENTPGNGVTVGGVLLKSGVIPSSAMLNLVNTAAIQDLAVTAPKLATSAILLGYSQITTSFSTTSTSPVQVTGLSATVTVPSGGRKVEIEFFSPGLYNSTNTAQTQVTIWDGTVGSGTQLAYGYGITSGSAASSGIAKAVVSPAPGSKTYNIGLKVGAGTGTVECLTTGPAYILVKAL